MPALAQQETQKLLTSLAQRSDSGEACAHQIARRLMCRIGIHTDVNSPAR